TRRDSQPDGDLARLMPRLDGADEMWCPFEFEFWPYPSDGLEPEEVISAANALYHGLTLQGHSDPDAIRPDLVSRVLVALERGAARTEARVRAPDAKSAS